MKRRRVQVTLEFWVYVDEDDVTRSGMNGQKIPEKVDGQGLRYLFCDALGEFKRARHPVEEYVATRYPEPHYQWMNRAEKVLEVEGRRALAEFLRNGAAGGEAKFKVGEPEEMAKV